MSLLRGTNLPIYDIFSIRTVWDAVVKFNRTSNWIFVTQNTETWICSVPYTNYRFQKHIITRVIIIMGCRRSQRHVIRQRHCLSYDRSIGSSEMSFFLHWLPSSASYFTYLYPLIFLRSSSSCLHIRLPATYFLRLPFNDVSRMRFLPNMWPILTLTPVPCIFIIYNSARYCTILITYDLLLHVSTLIRHLQGALHAWLKLHILLILINCNC